MIQTSTPNDNVRPLQWSDAGLKVLDQRLLPGEITYRLCDTAMQVAEAITTMQVRGAPAIGIAAAYGVVLAARQRYASHSADWKNAISGDLGTLGRSRPTAVNLFWALKKMRDLIGTLPDAADPCPALLAEAQAIHTDDIAANHKMGQLGAELLTDATGILTHCNTGSLATGGYGTALGVIRAAYAQKQRHIYATETRPWLQGSRLTVWELEQDGIPATLIADSAAPYLMNLERVQWVVVGADRITSTGDTANKIGTYALALAARYHGVRFMVVAPTSTIDWDNESGSFIKIEERAQSELLNPYFHRDDSLIHAWNPVFDVTPHELIDAIVTERGVILQPDQYQMQTLR